MNDLILSKKISYRIGRHLMFWLGCIWLFHIQNDERTLLYDGSALPAFIFSVYGFLCFQLPLLKKKQFIQFGFGLTIIWLITLSLSYLGSYLCWTIWSKGNIDEKLMANVFEMGLHNQVMAIWMGGVALGIKATKDWYMEMTATLAMKRQRVRNDLLMEKANLYPEFILQALDCLRLKIASGAAESPAILMNLSDSLSYILHDSQNELVELEKELVMVHHILEFKKMNWAERFTTHLSISGEPKDKLIPPLALFKLIENLFEIITKEPELSGEVQVSIEIENRSLTLSLTRVFVSELDTWKVRLAIITDRVNELHNEYGKFMVDGHEYGYSISVQLPLNDVVYPAEGALSQSTSYESVLA